MSTGRCLVRLLELLTELNRMGKNRADRQPRLALIRAAKSQVQARVLRLAGGAPERGGGRPVSVIGDILGLVKGEGTGRRVVPRSGQAAKLTVASTGAMAFLAVLRWPCRWLRGASPTAGPSTGAKPTMPLSAPATEIEAQTWAVLTVLEQTPPVSKAPRLGDDEQRGGKGGALLDRGSAPPAHRRPARAPPDRDHRNARGVRRDGPSPTPRRRGPAQCWTIHTRWRRPLVEAADRLRLLGWLSLALILGSTAAMITLAAQAALSAI